MGCGVRVHRLRQRRLARHFRSVRHATRGAPPEAHQPPLQEQSRRHVHRCDRRKAGLTSVPAGLRRCAWATTTTTASTISSVTYWGQNVLYRNNGDGTFTDVTEASGLAGTTARRAGEPAARSSTTTATAIWICSSRTIVQFDFEHGSEARRERRIAIGKACR